MKQDTLFLDKFDGEATFSYFLRGDSLIKDGAFQFNSYLQITENRYINKLIVNGSFKNGKRNGRWEYKEGQYEIDIKDLDDRNTLRLGYQLNGIEIKTIMGYAESLPNGRWVINQIPIQGNRRQGESNAGFIEFNKGIAVGSFEYLNTQDQFSLAGQLNKEGFLHGNIKISYQIDSLRFSEIRVYDDGFLLDLMRLDAEKGDTLLHHSFDDVKERLNSLSDTTQQVNFRKSFKGFGLTFNNGYKDGDKRLSIQASSNEILENYFHRYTYLLPEDHPEAKFPEFLFTRRFRFLYPKEEDSISSELRLVLMEQKEEIKKYLNRPRYIINMERSDSLSMAYRYMEQAEKKLRSIEEVLDKVDTGYFDYLDRDFYYRNGVLDLQGEEQLTYTYKDKEKVMAFKNPVDVQDHEDLFSDLLKYLQGLKKESNKWTKFSETEVQAFQEQAVIDSLDAFIFEHMKLIDSSYQVDKRKDRKFEQNETPLDWRFYNIINKNILGQLKEDYLEARDFEKKYDYGVELSCLLESMEEANPKLAKIENMRLSIDSLFTEFIDNPFDTRKAERKVLGNIYNKSMQVLYPNYINNLYRSDNCSQIDRRVNRFFVLEERLAQLVSEIDQEETRRIDKAIRRETVPSRIERILGLNF